MQSYQLPAGVLAVVMDAIHTRRRQATNLTRNTTITEVDATYEVGFDESHLNLVVLCSPEQTYRDRLEAELLRLQDEAPGLRTSSNLRVDSDDPNAEALRKRRADAKERVGQIEVRIAEIEAKLESSPDSRRLIIPVKDLAQFDKFHVEPVEGVAEPAEWAEAENAGTKGLLEKAIKERNGFEERVTLMEIEQADLKGKLKRAGVTVEAIAKAAHEANRAYCLSIGDDSQVPWEEAPDWQRESAAAGVAAYLANPDLTPEETHQKWMDHKAAEGWKYGETKDPEAKTHPCMVPYDQLPEDQQAKDHLYRAVVTSLIPLVPKTEDGDDRDGGDDGDDRDDDAAEESKDEDPPKNRRNRGTGQGAAREIAKSVNDGKKQGK